MYKPLFFILTLLFISCKEEKESIVSAQGIVDQAIAVSGGEHYKNSQVTFRFRDKGYRSVQDETAKVLERISEIDSTEVLDVLKGNEFQRYANGIPVEVPDSMAVKYANSINSVHYFVRLPFGLNDKAVQKKYLGTVNLKEKEYHKIQITFKQDGGGEDYEDVYIYWFDIETFKPDYLAYEFHTDGGGMRFREALNERYVEGIRFVDYNNFKPRSGSVSVYELDKLFESGQLDFLSKIELSNISVSPGNYN